MADTARPFWKTRRFYGAVFGVTGAALATIPAAPVIVTLGALAITTQTAAAIFSGIGLYVFGYGSGRAVERNEAKAKSAVPVPFRTVGK